MPEKLTEAQARAICKAFGINPDKIAWDVRAVLASSLTGKDEAAALFNSGAPAWRIVQRAAEEEKP